MKTKIIIVIGFCLALPVASFAVAKWWNYRRGDMIFYSTTQDHLVLPNGRFIPANRWLHGTDIHRDWKHIGLLQVGGENFLIIKSPHGLFRAGSNTNMIIRVEKSAYRSDEEKHRWWVSEANRPAELSSAHYQ